MALPDISDLSSVGGAKINAHPVEDNQTDLNADHHNIAMNDVTASTRTLPRAWVRATTAATSGAMIVVSHDSVWGNTVPVTPVLARIATGEFTVTWPASVQDQLGASHSLNFRSVLRPNVRGATLFHAQAEITAPNVVKFRVFAAGGAASDAVGTDFDIAVI